MSSSESQPQSSASSIRSVITSTGPTSQPSSSKFPYQLLGSPSFLICAGAILFRGISPPTTPLSSSPSTRKNLCTKTNETTTPSPSSSQSSSTSPSLSLTSPVLLGNWSSTFALKPLPPPIVRLETRDAKPGCDDLLHDDQLEVCIIYHQRKNEYILAKGRKDQFERDLLTAGLRETFEETGYPCRAFPVGMNTRAPLPGADIKDQKKGLPVLNCVEPFALTIRNIAPDNVKLIHWFIAEVTTDTAQDGTRMPSESSFQSCWFTPEEAVEKLTHEHDKEVVRKATGLVRDELKRRRKLKACVLE